MRRSIMPTQLELTVRLFCNMQVKFEQGMAMLNIFKIFASKTSILDDFEFYENRQRALTEKRARQHAQQQREQHRQVWTMISHVYCIHHSRLYDALEDVSNGSV